MSYQNDEELITTIEMAYMIMEEIEEECIRCRNRMSCLENNCGYFRIEKTIEKWL